MRPFFSKPPNIRAMPNELYPWILHTRCRPLFAVPSADEYLRGNFNNLAQLLLRSEGRVILLHFCRRGRIRWISLGIHGGLKIPAREANQGASRGRCDGSGGCLALGDGRHGGGEGTFRTPWLPCFSRSEAGSKWECAIFLKVGSNS